jgi:hypothetical protein
VRSCLNNIENSSEVYVFYEYSQALDRWSGVTSCRATELLG